MPQKFQKWGGLGSEAFGKNLYLSHIFYFDGFPKPVKAWQLNCQQLSLLDFLVGVKPVCSEKQFWKVFLSSFLSFMEIPLLPHFSCQIEREKQCGVHKHTIYFISIASVFSHVCMLHKAGMSVNAPFVAGWVATRTSPKLKLNLFSLLQVSS